ncbi:MAG: ABC transporter ATP-binding protein [Lachnospiraceae bacterium]|nr:ABC transporter ATP-binding protein [Lachnospiraceae bacterium]
MDELLKVEHLAVSFQTDAGELEAVRDVSFSLRPGEVLAIVGESGCGKSVLCKSIMKLLPEKAKMKSGSIRINDTDISACKEKEMQKLRGRLFAMVFQDPMTSLNPTMTIGAQIAEAILVHQPKMKKEAVQKRVLELMELVGIDRPEARAKLYPWNFSGGMRQRSVLAIALASDPAILIADEPTTALDVTIQAQILDLLKEIQRRLGTATILVSHDLGVVARVADRVAVMYAGKICEIGTAEEIYYDPKHPYTKGLLRSLPALSHGKETLHTLPGMPPSLVHPPKGDAFACRNEYALAIDYEQQPPMFRVSDTHYAATWLLDERVVQVREKLEQRERAELLRDAGKKDELTWKREGSVQNASERYTETENRQNIIEHAQPDLLLDVRHLTQVFPLTKKLAVRAVDDVSFQIRRGEIFGLVGESGSGKSTVARCVMNIYRPAGGQIVYRGIDTGNRMEVRKNRVLLHQERQMIFQDSASSLNQRMKVEDIVMEPMRLAHRRPPRGSYRTEAAYQLKYVGLDESCLDKYPSELSGGQRQRIAIARAVSMEPELLVADEPIASLDVSIQAQIVNLFRHLQREHGFSILFIAHDLAMVEFLCDRVGVMYHGRLVEVASCHELYRNPLHSYTQALLSAIPVPDPKRERERKMAEFEQEYETAGVLVEVSPGHFVLR